MGKYSQVFALQLQAATDEVWPALKRAIDDMDGAKLGSVNDEERQLSFSTGVTLTSWGEHMTAKVVPAGDTASDVQVRGKPTGTFLTTKVGEQVHASTIERRLRRAMDDQLRTAAT
jgi:hypothetical protein